MIGAYALLLHFVADFLLQSREMATNKSHDLRVLARHGTIINVVVGFGLMFAIDWQRALLIGFVNALVHMAIDWHIWRGYTWWVTTQHPEVIADTFRYWEDQAFYTTIGLDQFLHGATLLLLLGALT